MPIDKISFKQAVAAVTLVLIALLILSFNRPVGDFGNYYFGSKFFMDGSLSIADIYEPYRFNLSVFNSGHKDLFLSYTQVPPFTLLLYVPLCLMNILYAKLIWNAVNALLFLWLIYRLNANWKIETKFLLLIPIVLFQPLLSNFTQGQSYLLIVFLLVEGYFAYEKGRYWTSAILWSLAILLKIFPAVILLFLLFQKDFKPFFKCILVCFCLILMSGFFVGFNTWYEYMFNILPRLFNGEINNSFTPLYQSFQVFIKNIFVADAMHNPDPVFNNPALYHFSLIVFKIIVLASGAGISMNKNLKPLTVFATWIFFGMLISGYGSRYGLLLLFFPLIGAFESKSKILLLLLLFAICTIPIYWFLQFNLWLQFPRLYLMLAFAVIWIVVNKPLVKWYYIFYIVPVIFINDGPAENSKYFFKKEEALLIYDFEFINDSLRISFIDNKGPQKRMVDIHERIGSIVPFDYKPEEPGKERILRSVLINRNEIVYLSDKNRGVGFYTLRTVRLK